MEVFVARQPVLDREKRLYGYELLFRSDASTNSFNGLDGTATLQVISNGMFATGLEDLAGGKKAFLNLDRSMLVDNLCEVLPPQNVVLEILETIEPDDAVIGACAMLRAQGYLLALDDFVFSPRFEPLLALAHLVKLDVRSTPKKEAEELLRMFKLRGLAVLAEKVETHEEFAWALGAGFDYFQGYFFARPEIRRGKQIPTDKVSCLRLLQEVRRPDMNLNRVHDLICSDVSFSFKLLRYVNSAIFYTSIETRSITEALRRIGQNGVRRWALLAALPVLAQDKPTELLKLSLTRARFCEFVMGLLGSGAQETAFLAGMFSLLDALLDQNLDDALASAKAPVEICRVLLGKGGQHDPLALVYSLVLAYESADWTGVTVTAKALGLDEGLVSRGYLDALAWATESLDGERGMAAAGAVNRRS